MLTSELEPSVINSDPKIVVSSAKRGFWWFPQCPVCVKALCIYIFHF